MRTITIEEHASTPELYVGGLVDQLPPPIVAVLNDMGDGRLADMDAHGIDMQVLSMQPPLRTAGIDVPKMITAVKAFNDAAGAAVKAHPDRFAMFAFLPVHDASDAAKELERAVTELGAVGALIGTDMREGFVHQQEHWAIWEAAESLGVPVYMHPGLPPKAVFDSYYASLEGVLGTGMSTAMWGWHVDTGMHTIQLILRGVFDRFPKLQVIIGHMGEAIPFMLGRLEERIAGIAGSLAGFQPPFEKPIREYFKKNIHFSTSGFFDDESLICAISAVGADRIMLATDYPFSKNEDTRRFIDNAAISDADREAIAHGNAERLLKLKS